MIQLCVPVESINELENLRAKYMALVSPDPLTRAQVVTKVSSILNRFWKSEIEPRLPHLKVESWKNPMRFLQDIVGDEFKKESRPGLQWMQQKLSTEEFINRIAKRIQSLI